MDLQAIEARLAAATPGPWKTQDFVDAPPEDAGSAVVKQGNGGLVAYALRSGAVEHEWYDKPQCEADAEFIAHAPEDMKLLLDIAKRKLEDYSDFVAELVEENHTLKYQLEQIKVAISNHPNPCSKHPEDDPVSCGWKSAYIDVVETLAC